MIKIIFVPAFIFIIGGLLFPLLNLIPSDIYKRYIKKVYVLLLPALAFINIISIKPGTEYKFNFLNFAVIPLHVDRLSLFIGYIFIVVAFFALLYTLHIDNDKFTTVGLLYAGTALGVVFAGDFLTIYIFWELLALTGTGLILFNQSEEGKSAAFRYLIMHLMGGLLLLAGIWLYYLDAGTFVITRLHGLPLYFIVAGVGVNAGFILLHTWLPDSYPKAPYYASIFLSVYTTKTAVYMLARTAAGWEFIAYMGGAMAVFGVTMALMQGKARKLLSYHIISQVGYMVAGIGLGGALGVDGAMLHLANNLLYKSILFMGIGAVIYVVGDEELTKLGGLSKKMPITTVCVVIASLSITGMPLFSGYISKLLIFDAAHTNPNVTMNLVIYILLELAAVGTFLSFLKVSYFGFIKPNDKIEAKEAPLNMLLAMGGLAILSVLVGVVPGIFTKLLPFESTLPFYNFKFIIIPLQLFGVCIVAYYFGSKKVFVPHRRLTFDFDKLYIIFVESLAFIPAAFSTANDWIEAQSVKIPSLLAKTKRPLSTTLYYLSDFLFAIWVDFWLFTPTSSFEGTEAEKPEEVPVLVKYLLIPFNFITNFIDNLGRIISTIAANFDSNILDKTSRQVASDLLFNIEEFQTRGSKISKLTNKFEDKVLDSSSRKIASDILFNIEEFNAKGNRISSMSNMFDKYIIDGMVNAIAFVIWYFGERARRVQTGLVQNYALIIIFIVSIFIIILSIRGGGGF